MAGTWVDQNKVRPDLYMNFRTVAMAPMTIGDRGIVIIPLELDWGSEEGLIEVFSTELLNRRSLPKVGFTAFDEQSKVLGLVLRNCYKALVYRIPSELGSATKATAVLGELTVTAVYPGSGGNKIQIAIIDVGETARLRYEVKTYWNGVLQDRQRVNLVSDLIANSFVTWSISQGSEGEEFAGELEEFAGEPLFGGSNGTVLEESQFMPMFLSLAELAKWQVMCPMTLTYQQLIEDFIVEQNVNQGKDVQAVTTGYDHDHWTMVKFKGGGVMMGNIPISALEYTAWHAGATAGALMLNSLTGYVVEGATDIINELTHDEIIEALNEGWVVLSRTEAGKVAVERDINSFISFTINQNYAYAIQQVQRLMGEMKTTTRDRWQVSYKGKVQNDEQGRGDFKGDLAEYAKKLVSLRAIDRSFNVDTDLIVEQGEKINSVFVRWGVKPTVTMEFAYFDVTLFT